MKLITEPKVYLVGNQVLVGGPLESPCGYGVDKFLRDHGVTWSSDSEVGSEVLSEIGGRLCYMSFAKPRPGGNAAYLEHIKEVGHGSVVEHAVFSLIFTGVSRSLTHELVRHRAGMGYSQLSQRYVDESVAEYVVPRDLQQEVEAAEWFQAWTGGYMDTSHEGPLEAEAEFYKNHPNITREMVAAGNDWLDAVDVAHKKYVRLAEYLSEREKNYRYQTYLDHIAASRYLPPGGVTPPREEWWSQELMRDSRTEARKAARQTARSVLPNATETKIFVTMNGRAARHFLEMRGSRHAEPEIRVLASKVLDVLVSASPNLFSDYRKVALPDGTFELETEYRKV